MAWAMSMPTGWQGAGRGGCDGSHICRGQVTGHRLQGVGPRSAFRSGTSYRESSDLSFEFGDLLAERGDFGFQLREAAVVGGLARRCRFGGRRAQLRQVGLAREQMRIANLPRA